MIILLVDINTAVPSLKKFKFSLNSMMEVDLAGLVRDLNYDALH